LETSGEDRVERDDEPDLTLARDIVLDHVAPERGGSAAELRDAAAADRADVGARVGEVEPKRVADTIRTREQRRRARQVQRD
jgi:hypothetical protein